VILYILLTLAKFGGNMAKQRRPGIRCSVCESQDTSVKQTKKGHRHVVRYRKCITCSHTFRTIELNAMHIPTDAKFDFLFREDR